MSVSNFKLCEGVFRSYMSDRHGVAIPHAGEDAARAKRALFRVMEDVQRRVDAGELSGTSTRVKNLNNLALNAARDVLLAERPHANAPPAPALAPPPPPATAPSAAERDRDLYGDRRLSSFQLLPAPSAEGAPHRAEVSRTFEVMAAARKADAEPAAPPSWNGRSDVEGAIQSDDFQRQLQALEKERERQAQASRDLLPPPPGANDPAAVQRSALADQDAFREMQRRAAQDEDGEPIGNQRAMTLIPPPEGHTERTVVERYIAINAGDRDVSTDPYRYRFAVTVRGFDANDLAHSHKDIEWIEPSCVIVPMEAVLPAGADRGFHQFDFGMSYQYLVLNIEGFEGTYDGTNEAARQAFCMLRYRRSYRANNGRGFIQLEPMQAERRVFWPAPMSALRTLRISLLRPNGALFNNSLDSIRVVSLEYDPTERLFLTFVLDRFYDMNEFVVGDMVLVSGFRTSPNAADPDSTAFTNLDAFINRPEGHEIVRIPAANEQGFSRKLVVLAPGVLDLAAGAVIVDGRLVRAAQQLSSASAPASVATQGRGVNASLQCILMLKIGERRVASDGRLPHALPTAA